MEVTAYAKLNLTLEVLGPRDDGFHQVRSVLQTIGLADRLTIETAATLRVACDDPSLDGEANLVWNAARALANRGGITAGARISIAKGIPVSMGLGGGSSDAAAALIGLNQLWGLALGIEDLRQVASELGSDVAFFLNGGTALAEGRGEVISPLPALPNMPVLLACPNISIQSKTATMYSRLTLAHYSDGGITSRLIQILMGGQFVLESVAGLTYNIFEEVAYQVFPQLEQIWRLLDSISTNPVRLAGAGPALFCLPATEAEFQEAANALQPLGVGVYLVNTVVDIPGALSRA
ncbi:MAG: 4-(cytidine 5'-diphospho)-2-C-methyl-D-erythritol kinase [SAR202 cluster bacterium Io17-Chloro-G9]|nr:MAG: 4-(cytidine 5'-diphospho)-2-C-methyl-D-erythritol kinase [SAR202 cluster bacterium Io17-Chloro-G9]